MFCVDIDKYQPDLVLIDFSVNDYGHPKLMEALIRKVLVMKSRPLVVLANLWVKEGCPVTRYLLHGYYYDIPVLNVCPAVNICFGKKHMPKEVSDLYSKTDGVHPWGKEGVRFLGDLLYAWWKRMEGIVGDLVDSKEEDNKFLQDPNHEYNSDGTIIAAHRQLKKNVQSIPVVLKNSGFNKSYEGLPVPLYSSNPIGLCTRCDALADDADGMLMPIGQPKGFRMVTRVKIGYGGFDPKDKSAATKSFKRSWQAEEAGSEISFPFYGSSVKLAMWQRRDGMGVLHAYVDGDKSKIAKASGFFKGYTWAMERNNTGRSEILPLFEGLEDKQHTLTLLVSDEPANVWVPGHIAQIYAILSASDDIQCKHKIKQS